MNILAVDDEAPALENLVECIQKAQPSAQVAGFDNGLLALDYAQSEPVEIAFLDISMRELDGISLAKRLKLCCPKINLIFTTGYSEYTADAMLLRASGYVIKPITPQKITEELENLRTPLAPADCGQLRVQTFGNFEVFAGGQPLRFKYSKTLELLAYLVDRRGALCTNNEIMAVLWGDTVNESYFKKLRSDLSHTFSELGYDDILVKQWGKLGISPEKLSCDYYDWTAGKLQAINAYQGEYMTQYSWAEATLGKIRSEF